jgi:hypothetical protein
LLRNWSHLWVNIMTREVFWYRRISIMTLPKHAHKYSMIKNQNKAYDNSIIMLVIPFKIKQKQQKNSKNYLFKYSINIKYEN